MQGCRPGREPSALGRLTSAVDAPAHSALSTLLAARGRRRDQHRGGRTAPGIPGGAGRSGGQSEHWIPCPQRRGRLVMKRDNNPAGGCCFKGTAASSFRGWEAARVQLQRLWTQRKKERDGDEDSTGQRMGKGPSFLGVYLFIYIFTQVREGSPLNQRCLSSDS